LKRNFEIAIKPKRKNYSSKIVGIFLIIIGIVLLFVPLVPLAFNLKMSLSLIFLGIILILMINKTKINQGINEKQLTLILLFLTWIVLMVTIDAEIDVYIVLLAIGIFAIKEFFYEFLDIYLQRRLNFLFYISFILFVVIVVKRIITLSGMYPG
jgi:hypothetical protein